MYLEASNFTKNTHKVNVKTRRNGTMVKSLIHYPMARSYKTFPGMRTHNDSKSIKNILKSQLDQTPFCGYTVFPWVWIMKEIHIKVHPSLLGFGSMKYYVCYQLVKKTNFKICRN